MIEMLKRHNYITVTSCPLKNVKSLGSFVVSLYANFPSFFLDLSYLAWVFTKRAESL